MRSWIETVRTWSRPVAPEVKRSATGPIIALHMSGRPVWTPRNYQALAREGFSGNAVGYRCVRMIAEAAASVPWLLYEGEAEIGDHPILDLLMRPNPGMSGQTMLEIFYGHLQVAGNAYLEAVAMGGTLRELHVLRPDRMKVVPGKDGWPEGYEYSANGATVRFEQQSGEAVPPILHLRLFNPIDDHYGLSPLEAAAASIDVHNAAAAWNKALLDNAARPSGALVFSGAGGEGKGTGSVDAASDDRILAVSGLSGFADNWFRFGKLAWTSGANAGRIAEVKGHAGGSTVTLTLWQRAPSPVEPGDAFTVTAGCDKTLSTCGARFDNIANFRGFPHMPGNDRAFAYVVGESGENDGGSFFD